MQRYRARRKQYRHISDLAVRIDIDAIELGIREEAIHEGRLQADCGAQPVSLVNFLLAVCCQMDRSFHTKTYVDHRRAVLRDIILSLGILWET